MRAIDRLLFPLYENDEKWARSSAATLRSSCVSPRARRRAHRAIASSSPSLRHIPLRPSRGHSLRASHASSWPTWTCVASRCSIRPRAQVAAGKKMMQALEQRLLALGGPLTAGSIPPPAVAPVPMKAEAKAPAAPRWPEAAASAAARGRQRQKSRARPRPRSNPVTTSSTPPALDLSPDDQAERAGP